MVPYNVGVAAYHLAVINGQRFDLRQDLEPLVDLDGEIRSNRFAERQRFSTCRSSRHLPDSRSPSVVAFHPLNELINL
jgi:hypothetical protein